MRSRLVVAPPSSGRGREARSLLQVSMHGGVANSTSFDGCAMRKKSKRCAAKPGAIRLFTARPPPHPGGCKKVRITVSLEFSDDLARPHLSFTDDCELRCHKLIIKRAKLRTQAEKSFCATRELYQYSFYVVKQGSYSSSDVFSIFFNRLSFRFRA